MADTFSSSFESLPKTGIEIMIMNRIKMPMVILLFIALRSLETDDIEDEWIGDDHFAAIRLRELPRFDGRLDAGMDV